MVVTGDKGDAGFELVHDEPRRGNSKYVCNGEKGNPKIQRPSPQPWSRASRMRLRPSPRLVAATAPLG